MGSREQGAGQLATGSASGSRLPCLQPRQRTLASRAVARGDIWQRIMRALVAPREAALALA